MQLYLKPYESTQKFSSTLRERLHGTNPTIIVIRDLTGNDAATHYSAAIASARLALANTMALSSTLPNFSDFRSIK